MNANASSTLLFLPGVLWEAMQAHVERMAPEEACGLLAGPAPEPPATGWMAAQTFPITNALHSRVRYRMEPQEQLAAFLEIEQQGWELCAIYHSHPHGPAGPSPTDIVEAYYPEVVYLIWSRGPDERWQCGGFRIIDGQVYKVPLMRVEG